MERKLASVQRVKRIDPIKNRDKIAMATVLGWHVIVRKDEIKEGDLIVYIETDSILPDTEPFKDIPEKKRRIRMRKMAGVYSQGICFPLSILPEWNYEEGDDATASRSMSRMSAMGKAHGIITGTARACRRSGGHASVSPAGSGRSSSTSRTMLISQKVLYLRLTKLGAS